MICKETKRVTMKKRAKRNIKKGKKELLALVDLEPELKKHRFIEYSEINSLERDRLFIFSAFACPVIYYSLFKINDIFERVVVIKCSDACFVLF